MIVDVKAKFECDDCGTEFLVELDIPSVCPAEWTVFEIAEDAIRRGQGYEDGTDEIGACGSDEFRLGCDWRGTEKDRAAFQGNRTQAADANIAEEIRDAYRWLRDAVREALISNGHSPPDDDGGLGPMLRSLLKGRK